MVPKTVFLGKEQQSFGKLLFKNRIRRRQKAFDPKTDLF